MLQLWNGSEQSLYPLLYFIAIFARHGQAEVTPAEIATSVTPPPRVLCGKVSLKKTFVVGIWDGVRSRKLTASSVGGSHPEIFSYNLRERFTLPYLFRFSFFQIVNFLSSL